jgi:hypothetical protein
VRCGWGRAVAPDLVDEPLERDNLVRMKQQQRQDRPLLLTTEGERTTTDPGFERPEERELNLFVNSRLERT